MRKLLGELLEAASEVGIDSSEACEVLTEESVRIMAPQFATVLLEDSDKMHSKLQGFKDDGVFILAFQLPNVPVPTEYFVEGLLTERAVFPVKTEREYDRVVDNMETFLQRHIGVLPDELQRKVLECHQGPIT